MHKVTDYRVEAWAPDCHLYWAQGSDEPEAQWIRLHDEFREGVVYFGGLDALSAARYAAKAAEKFYVKVRILKMQRIKTYVEEEVDFSE